MNLLHRKSISTLFAMFAATLLLFSTGVSSQEAAEEAPAPTATLYTTVEGISEYRLDNGLRVILFPDRSAERTSVVITYFVGAAHEGYGEKGLAHYLEHMVFKGTPGHPDIPAELTNYGARANGTTWLDRTNYYETFGATEENLEWALDLEADRMINSFLDADEFETERSVILSEWEQGENNPWRVLGSRLNSAAFLWHNYSHSTIGSRSDIENVTLETMKAFYRKYYQPDNAQLVIAGKFDEERALELVLEKFGSIPRPERTGKDQLLADYSYDSPQDGEKVVHLERVGDIQLALMGYKIPSGTSVDFPALRVLAFIFGSGPSSRLYKSIVEPGIATGAGSFTDQFKHPGMFRFSVSVPKEDSMETAIAEVEAQIAEMIENGPTEEEVERAKQLFLTNIELSFNDPIGIANQLSEWGAKGDWRLMFIYRDNLEKVTVEDVHSVAKTYLKTSNRTTAYFHPLDEAPARVSIPHAPSVESQVEGYVGREAVAAGEEFDPSPANIESRTTFRKWPNGATLALLPKENRGDTVSVSIQMRYSNESLAFGKSYIASMASSMPMRGTVNKNRAELSDEFTRLKLNGSVSGGLTFGSISINTVRENLPEAIKLMGEIAKEPAWDQEEFDLIKRQTITSIESSMSEPGALGSEKLQRHLRQYEKGDPRYVSTMQEDIEGYSSVSLDEAKSFYEEFVGLGPGTTITVVGDYDPDEIVPLLEEEFGNWNSGVDYERIATNAQGQPAIRESINTPDKANALMFAGFDFLMTQSHPDYEAMVVAGHIMGGGFLNSRLATRIRQKEGLSYGVGAYFSAHPFDERASFGAQANSAPENSSRVVTALLEEITKAVEGGFTDKEVEDAIESILDRRKNSRTSDGAIAGLLHSNMFWNRTMDFTVQQEEKIASLTATEVSAAFARHIHPDKVSIVTAGDFEKVANTDKAAPESGE